jgi:hypothetical protein
MNTNLPPRTLCYLIAMGALGCFACGGGIPPSSAAAEAHVIAQLATGARGDLQQCTQQPDGGACAQVNTDLCDVIDQAKQLESLAIDAGFTPAQPVVTCPKK